MSKLSAKLKNNQAYLMYWVLVCALCVGVTACSTGGLLGPKGDVQITGEIEEEKPGDAQITGEIEEEKPGDAQITGEIEEEKPGDVEIIGQTEE